MSNDNSQQPATKQDVEEIVGRVVGGILGETMQLISERFDSQNATIGDMLSALNRVENKLDATVNQDDDHEIRLRKLEPKIV